jgi:pimeloyl-ACP methyl ester carboxylesterase
VVLLHQHPADLCGFWPYAVYLSKRGLQALAIDLRCEPTAPSGSPILDGSTPLDTGSAAKRLSVPVLFAVARDDPNVPVESVQALYRMAPVRDKQLAILGGSSTGLHGWDLLGGVNGASFTPFAAKVAGFVGQGLERQDGSGPGGWSR